MATLHLMVGLPCSGKTTRAKELEREQFALRLTPDEWHVQLFGQDAEEREHDARHHLIEMMLWTIARRALELGMNVILDFGFWAREEREDYRARAKALEARPSIPKALPALKPNQPIQSSMAPTIVYVRLCGGIGSLP